VEGELSENLKFAGDAKTTLATGEGKKRSQIRANTAVRRIRQ